jgi:hypothetical protein
VLQFEKIINAFCQKKSVDPAQVLPACLRACLPDNYTSALPVNASAVLTFAGTHKGAYLCAPVCALGVKAYQ